MSLSHADYARANQSIANMYRLAYTAEPCQVVAAVLAQLIGGISNTALLKGNEVTGDAVSEPELLMPITMLTPMTVQLHPRFMATHHPGLVCGISDYLSRAAWHRSELHQVARGGEPARRSATRFGAPAASLRLKESRVSS